MKLIGRFLFGLPMISFDINGKEIECLVDTGFNGQLLLPQNIIDRLDLQEAGTYAI